MEVRQRARNTGAPTFDANELGGMLTAFGDDYNPLPETIRVLDQIVTDFIIETCYEAEAHARYAGRQKVKVDDFQFALRHDSKKLGRVQELLDMDRELKKNRKAFDVPDEGKIVRDEEKTTKRGRKAKEVEKEKEAEVRESVERGRSKSVNVEDDFDMDVSD